MIAIIIISIALVSLATYELIEVKQINEKLVKDAYYLEQITKDNKDNIVAISKDIKDIKDSWNKVEPTLCLMFNHKDLSTVTDTLTLIEAYVNENNYDDTFAQVHLLIEYANKCDHVMGFNMQNLL